MTLWLSPLKRWWSWISNDMEKTHVIECRASVLEVTTLMGVPPPIEAMGSVAPPRTWAIPRRTEKRAAVRYPCDRAVRCVSDEAKVSSIIGRVRNLSTTGMGLVVGHHIEPGTLLLLEMACKAIDATCLLTVRVIHARRMPVRGWFLGCEFPQELSPADIQGLI